MFMSRKNSTTKLIDLEELKLEKQEILMH
jgi:hypothetical protein